MNIYERYGRKQESFEEMYEELVNIREGSLRLVRELKAGSVALDDVEVFDDGWRVKPRQLKPQAEVG